MFCKAGCENLSFELELRSILILQLDVGEDVDMCIHRLVRTLVPP
jgi:hypothetical protein